MSKTVEEIRKELDAKIPRDCVSSREGSNGRTLSYLEGHYVIDRLNQVLGQGNWEYNTEEMRLVHAGAIETRNGPTSTCHYVAKVSLTVYGLASGEEHRGRTFSDYGYGDGTDKTNPGKAHELAAKEAVTDGLKRCAKNLGMSMGLALYDKTQENVENEPKKAAFDRVGKPAPNLTERAPAPKNEGVAPVVEEGQSSGSSQEALVKAVSEAFRVAEAKKKITKDLFQAGYRERHKVQTLKELNVNQLQSELSTIEALIS